MIGFWRRTNWILKTVMYLNCFHYTGTLSWARQVRDFDNYCALQRVLKITISIARVRIVVTKLCIIVKIKSIFSNFMMQHSIKQSSIWACVLAPPCSLTSWSCYSDIILTLVYNLDTNQHETCCNYHRDACMLIL